MLNTFTTSLQTLRNVSGSLINGALVFLLRPRSQARLCFLKVHFVSLQFKKQQQKKTITHTLTVF